MMLEGVHRQWGQPPWQTDFPIGPQPPPAQVDIAIVGGGFTGLTAAACLSRLSPQKSVAVFEANRIGSGSSARTGAIVMGETAVGEYAGEAVAYLDRIASAGWPRTGPTWTRSPRTGACATSCSRC